MTHQAAPLEDQDVFLRQWLLATAGGVVIGTILSWYSARMALHLAEEVVDIIRNWGTSAYINQNILTIPPYLVKNTHVGAVIGIPLGIGQWLVLRKWAGWAKHWLFASLLGGIGSYLIMGTFNLLAIVVDPQTRFIAQLAKTGILIGTVMGVAQWWVLRRYVHHAGWWILAQIGIWVGGTTANHLVGPRIARMVVLFLGSTIRRITEMRGVSPYDFLFWGHIAVLILGGSIGGLITGKLLLRLMKKPVE